MSKNKAIIDSRISKLSTDDEIDKTNIAELLRQLSRAHDENERTLMKLTDLMDTVQATLKQLFGVTESTSDAVKAATQGDIIVRGGKSFIAEYEGANRFVRVAKLTADGVISVGPDADGAGIGQVKIPVMALANLPAGAAKFDGIIVVNPTANQLIYYSGGLRYQIAIGAVV